MTLTQCAVHNVLQDSAGSCTPPYGRHHHVLMIGLPARHMVMHYTQTQSQVSAALPPRRAVGLTA